MMTTMLLVRHKARRAVNGVFECLAKQYLEASSTYASLERIVLHKCSRFTIEAIQPQQPALIWRALNCTIVDH
jgi:hypothetical protein